MSHQGKELVLVEDDDDDNEIVLTFPSKITKHLSLSQRSRSKPLPGKSGFSKIAPSFSSKRKQDWISSSFDGFRDLIPSQDASRRKKKQSNLSSSFPVGSNKPAKTVNREDGLWIDKYKPKTETELAVHKKKIAEVRSWLLEHLCSKLSSAILLLTGPVGAGKTATLHTLSTELSFEIQEWVNPLVMSTEDGFNSDLYSTKFISSQSQLSQFQEFLLRANRYPTLSIFGSRNETTPRKLVLIEDLPNIFFRDAKKLQEVLQSYRQTGRSPLVLIISDSHHSDSNVHRLLPKNLHESLGVHTISFNPVAHTSLVKTLNRLAAVESQKAGKDFLVPSKDTIEELAHSSAGDIRTAINALQFFCLRGRKTSSFKKSSNSSSQPTGSQKHAKHTLPHGSQSSKMIGSLLYGKGRKTERDAEAPVTAIGGRDTTIFLFRALGKILYCKREATTSDKDLLPSHLTQCARNTPQFCPEDVAERAHLSSELLTMYLHQNYLDFFTDMDDVDLAIEYMSDADMMMSEWMHRSSLIPYMSSIAIRGIMFTNTHRDSTSSSGTSRGGWRPLHKPHWYEVNKRMRDNVDTARDLFPDQTCPTTVLHTQILPYLAITDAPLKTPGQIAFVQQIGGYRRGRSRFRSFAATLDEKDFGGDSDEDDVPGSQPESSSARQLPETGTAKESSQDARELETAEMEILSSEDVVIDDFDDDW